MEHYPSLLATYAAALAGWVCIWRARPELWPRATDEFAHPWREAGYALIAAVGIVAIGQVYTAGISLPNDGVAGPILESINQLLIFSPVVLLLIVRKQPLETAWIKKDRIGCRLLIGLGLALIALLVYTLVRSGADGWMSVVLRTYRYENVALALQVFLEDFTIAVLAVRISACIGAPRTVVLVAALFAAGHIPTMIAEGASLRELASLIGDTGLGVAVISAGLRSRDIWWIWPVHFSMDMTQFERITGIAA